MQTYILSTLVENKPGVLFRISNLIRRRNFNIDSISVGATEQPDVSCMTITLTGEEETMDQIISQLRKLIDVVEVRMLNPDNSVYRELALIKLKAGNSRDRADIINFANIFRSRVVDVSPESMTVEVTGTPDKIDAFIQSTASFGILQVARTGITAVPRGSQY